MPRWDAAVRRPHGSPCIRGDEIVVSKAEHHSVLLPFQELAARTGATLKWLDLDEEGRIRSDMADEVITERTRVVAVTHVANVTGAITDLAPIVRRAHAVGALVVLDACQSVPHLKVDVHALDVDFAVWSAHKMYGPTGVGFLYGRRELLEALPPGEFRRLDGRTGLDGPSGAVHGAARQIRGRHPAGRAGGGRRRGRGVDDGDRYGRHRRARA